MFVGEQGPTSSRRLNESGPLLPKHSYSIFINSKKKHKKTTKTTTKKTLINHENKQN